MTRAWTGIGSALLQVGGSQLFLRRFAGISGVVSASALLWVSTALAQSLPNGGTVAAGDVTITQPSGSQLNINQGSDAAIVNWNGFSVGSGATVDIHQPGADSVILNRVTGNTTSQIHGQLNANGQVHLVNPNGIFIGPSGHVNTAGFVASTLDISDDDFLNGRYRYRGSGNSAAVENAGTISIVPGGYAALIGGKVSNSGLIRVPLGKVGLGAGEQVTLDISGDGFLQVAVPSDSDDDAMEALVSNSGRIEADGGLVHLEVASARNAARQVINMSGVIEARSVGGVSGAVVLAGSGGAVHVSGTIDTSARETLVASSPRPVVRPQTGGEITITGEAIALAGATLDASGAGAADGGSIRVGGDLQGQGDLQRAQTTTVDADSRLIADGGSHGNGGRIIVWSDYVTSFSGFNSARGGDEAGDGGFVEVSGKIQLNYQGLTDTRAPFGFLGTLLLDPSNIEINSSGALGTIRPTTLATNLETANLILSTNIPRNNVPDDEPGNIIVEEAISWSGTGDLTLFANNNIDFNAAITAPLGGLTINAGGTIETSTGGSIDVGSFSLLSGSWEQVGSANPSFAASDFSISAGATFLRAAGGTGAAASPYQLTDVYGLQGIGSTGLNAANFELVNDIDASSTSGWSGGFQLIETFDGTLEGNRFAIDGLFINDPADVVGIFRNMNGTVQNLSVTNADVTGLGGGILTVSNTGTISGVMTSGSIMTTQQSTGGLAAFNSGTIVDSFSTASVDVATPDSPEVEFAFAQAGGLVGLNTGNIIRSHSTGPVTASSNGGSTTDVIIAGGLVGENSGGSLGTGVIQDSYSTSSVTGISLSEGSTDPVFLGGLTGQNVGGDIERSFATGAVEFSGIGAPLLGGLSGRTVDGSVTGSFWNAETTGQTTSAGGGTALTTAQLQDTQGFFDLASAEGWDFTNVWAPGNGSTNPANYSTSPVVFAVPNSVEVSVDATSGVTTTGTISGGPSVFRFGAPSDTLDTSGVFDIAEFASTAPSTTTFTLEGGDLVSADGQVYRVAFLPGTAVITDNSATVVPAVTAPDTMPTTPPTPTVDITPTVDTTITGEGGGGTAITTVTEAEAALGTVEDVSQGFDSQVAACESDGLGAGEYLACLANAMDDYAEDLDAIVKGLPPGLESVDDIIRGASAGIREAGEEASRKLALATTAEERAAIRSEAIQVARREIRQAQREIRKAITLIRASDPELVMIQNQQVETIVAAVGQAEIGLSRAIGL